MRKLIILRGAPGCGKSTFIKEKDLERFTLSSDTIRLLFNSPELTSQYTEMIPQYNNQKVWDLLLYLLEERMKKGEFTIIDAVHQSKEDLAIYKKLASKYRYRLYLLDFTHIKKEEVIKRNKNRIGYKVVPDYSIEKAYKQFAKEDISKSFTVIEPENFEKILTTSPKDCNTYQNIHIFGDIHGCYTALKTYFEQHPFEEKDFYIFTGDYFDRGIENALVFEYLSNLIEQKNTLFLIGNHEDKLYKYACDDPFIMDYDCKNTIEEFEKAKISKSKIRGFIKKLSQIAYITFKGKEYLITHGGISYFPNEPLDYYSTNSFIYGIDKYEVDIDKIYEDFMAHAEKKVIQIHGHRNYFKNAIDKYSFSYNLEGDIEHGGSLRVMTLKENGKLEFIEIANAIYNPNLIEETTVYNLINTLRKSNFVYEKDLGNAISSFNFTKEAFYNHVWDHITMKARGLFIDTQKNRIIARSYDKFFQINERKESELEEVEKQYTYPISCYLKYNGFLGILSVVNDELFFASKSTNTGEYVQYFKNIFYESYDDKTIQNIKNELKKENATFVFEVIDPLNDPHIIKYQKCELILLDCIKNQTEFQKLSYEKLKEFATKNRISLKEKILEIKTPTEFAETYQNITESDYKFHNEYIEGVVFESQEHYMVKAKTKYYTTWKYLRTKMENALKNNKFRTKTKDNLERNFLNYLQEKYENQSVDISKINIIEEREEFLQKNKLF